MPVIDDAPAEPVDLAPAQAPAPTRARGGARRLFMRPRRTLVKVHRWLGILLFLWLCVIGLTGAWLVESSAFESWLHPARFEHTDGDVGEAAVLAAATEALPEGSSTYGLTEPSNGRGVYLVYGEGPLAEDAPEGAEPEYFAVYVDPGTGEVNGVQEESEGLTRWLYRGHEFLWQDQGVAAAFAPGSGWCRTPDGGEPGGARGVACDVLPDGTDLIGWFAVLFLVLLGTGFYLWYWPGVRRWATALVVKRGRGAFAFNLSLHRVIGLVTWVPLTVIAFTGAAFAFPNMVAWYDNATPAERDFNLWEPEEEILSGEAAGREPITPDEAVRAVEERFPGRAIRYVGLPLDETGTYQLWVTRGFDPWTRQGGAGNVYVWVDQYSGEIVYDGTPEDGNVFDQAWDDWNFPLHTGDFGGPVTRVLWFFVGISPVVLGVTGLVMNQIRRRKRAKRRQAPSPVVGSSAVA